MSNRKKLLAVVVASGIFAAGGFTAITLDKPVDIATATEAFYGENQNGIEVARQAHATYLALDIREGIDKAAVGRMMRVLTADAALLTQGKGIIGDSQFEMAEFPARLTITFGFGYSLFAKIGAVEDWPIAQKEIPEFTHDALEEPFNDGDLLIQVAGDEPTSVFHAVHELARDVSPFATIRWQQRGFLNTAGVNEGKPTRNLLGQIDGTANPEIGSALLKKTVWKDNSTTMVIRRIRFDLAGWDKLSTNKKNLSLGRTLADGERLTDPAAEAHAQIAKSNTTKLLRKGFNYDDNYLANGTHDVGLIFTSFQANLDQFIAIQKKLDAIDSLNTWTKTVGSALFIIPKGVMKDDWVGSSLLG